MRKKRLLFSTCLALMLSGYNGTYAIAQTNGVKYEQVINSKPLTTVLKQLEERFNTKIVFSYEDLASYKVNAKVKANNLTDALNQVLAGLPVSFTQHNGFISVKKNTSSKGSVPMTKINTSTVKVRGKVVDSKGESIPAATIQVAGKKGVGIVTDENGYFTIDLEQGKGETLVASFLGMKTSPYYVNCRKDVNDVVIKLEEDKQVLNEVIVTGLFNYRQSSFTGSSSSYTQDDLKSVGNQNVLKSLANLDPAFFVDNNTLNGSNPNTLDDISIRGNSSFSGLQGEYSGNPNAPLFILDGFESTQQQIFDLDMNRVKSVTVLKDAAAKSLYGSKAANGVVVVETIEPETGRLRVTYNGDLNIQAPDLTSYDLCNAAEKLQVEYNAGRYTSADPNYNQALREQYNAIQQNIARGVDTYWLSQPLRTGVGQKHTVYMEGGDQRMRYSANVSYNGIKGVMKGSDRNTISGNVKLSYRYKDFLFRNSLSITSNKAVDSPYGSFSDYVSVNPYYSPYDENGNLVKVLGTFTPAGYGATTLVYYNPLYNASIGTKNQSKYTEYTENFYIEWRPLESLRFTGRVGYTYQTNKREDFYPGDHTSFVEWTGDNYYKRGSYSITDGESHTLSSDITANYNAQFGKNLLLANAAWSLSETSTDTHGMTAWGFLNNHVDHISFAKQYADNGRPSGSEGTTRQVGVTGAVNYSYDNRYLADLSIRFDGSSVYGSDNRWGTFWSAGLGWNLHNEKFIKRLKFVDLFKIRGSYGLTGSQNFNPYQAKATYKFYDNISYDNITGAYLMAMSNNQLKWQQTDDLNIGFDMQLFKQLNVRFDAYKSTTKDALLAMTLPTSTGFSSYYENLGNVENTGFEATVNWRFYQKGNNYFSVNASIGHNTNKVTKINDALKSFNDKAQEDADNNKSTAPVIRYEEGQSMTAIWAVRSLGIDPTTGRELFLKKDGVTTTYNYDTNDKVVVGDSNPKYHGNFGFSGEYQGFGATCSFSYRFGGDYYNQTLVDRVENVNVAYNVDRRVLHDTWQNVGDMAIYKHISSTPSTTYPTSRFVEKYNELQLASFSCYYDFKYMSWLKRIKMERLKLSFNMSDVFHISTVKTERGLNYPYARSFSFSLAATF